MARKLLALLISVILLASAAGCSGGKENNTLSLNVGMEPRYMDPALNNAIDGGMYIDQVFEGLTRFDKDGKVIPGMAEKWEISADGTKYTFHLRKASWSDGKPVKAQEFEYAWKRALDPKTASEYAYMLYVIKNGEAFNGGKAKAEDVGVKALDDKTLEVMLEAPTAYFIDITNFTTMHPVRKDIIEKHGDQWTQKPETYIGNGPFVLEKWDHNSEITLKKNDNYYDKGKVKLSKIVFKLIEERAASLNAFESGDIQYIYDHVPPEETQKLINDGKVKVFPDLSTYYYIFNTKKAPFDNVKVRKAFALAIDRKAIVDKVTRAGEKAADNFVPPGVNGEASGKDFRSEADYKYLPEKADVEAARKLLAEAGYADGKGFPEIELIYNTDERHKKIAEAVQEQLKQNLGVNIKISNMEWKVLQQKRQNKDFTLSRDGWVGDYNDPMTFMDLWLSNSGNNNTQWSSAQYDDLIKKAKSTIDQKARMKAMHDAERLLLEDVPILPIFYYVKPVALVPELKDVVLTVNGRLSLMHAYFE
ncbi:MAG: peptide ABC transporter substrate-binding protein [Clostridia bacterium]|nr:peptide ABC transporter substrate-binding protein [Clostridia bacterium]